MRSQLRNWQAGLERKRESWLSGTAKYRSGPSPPRRPERDHHSWVQGGQYTTPSPTDLLSDDQTGANPVEIKSDHLTFSQMEVDAMGDALVHCIAVQDPDCLPMLAIARSASEAPSPFQDRWHGVLSIAFSSGEVGLDVAEDGRVTEVLPGSPAAGGVQVGDYILSVSGSVPESPKVRNYHDLLVGAVGTRIELQTEKATGLKASINLIRERCCRLDKACGLSTNINLSLAHLQQRSTSKPQGRTLSLCIDARDEAAAASWFCDDTACAGSGCPVGMIPGVWKEALGVPLGSLTAHLHRNPHNRVILTGHGVGGSLAVCVTMRLLDAVRVGGFPHPPSPLSPAELEASLLARVRCISFGEIPVLPARDLQAESTLRRAPVQCFCSVLRFTDTLPAAAALLLSHLDASFPSPPALRALFPSPGAGPAERARDHRLLLQSRLASLLAPSSNPPSPATRTHSDPLRARSGSSTPPAGGRAGSGSVSGQASPSALASLSTFTPVGRLAVAAGHAPPPLRAWVPGVGG